ncbi:MAG TPA: hypothetical protein VFW65_00480 [Pseudonocardiaceae bacterium]|nr:hypothetical protein [Pseudonocardiaceae bacterium]
MIDPLALVFLLVIVVCVPLIGYLLPQDPRFSELGRCRRHRRMRRRVNKQRAEQRRGSG